MNRVIDIAALEVAKHRRVICSVQELRVLPGERVAVRGANGTGKTTLLRVLAGLETAFHGQCIVEVERRNRGYVHQSPIVFRGTVLANVAYGLRARGCSREESHRRARPWLERLGLAALTDCGTRNLSGGERRRVALARQLVLAPELILLDEPFADLDRKGSSAVLAALAEFPESTILVAGPNEVPDELGARTIVLHCGDQSTESTAD